MTQMYLSRILALSVYVWFFSLSTIVRLLFQAEQYDGMSMMTTKGMMPNGEQLQSLSFLSLFKKHLQNQKNMSAK